MTRPAVRGSTRRLGVAGAIVLLAGCAYFNGVYNAREAERSADKQRRRGKEADAAASYAVSAAKAESVLARFPRSRWADDALLIAGRGLAYSDQCSRAIERLEAWLALPGQKAEDRDEASVALGSCYVRAGRIGEALELLEPRAAHRDRGLARTAALWAGRAAIVIGDAARASRMFAIVGSESADWELAQAALAAGNWPIAESLYAARAQRGDFRPEVLTVIDELWQGGRTAGVDTILERYYRSRLAARDKAALLLRAADLMIAGGQDERARGTLLRARRLATDTILHKEATARLTLLALRPVGSLLDVTNLIARARDAARGAPLFQRLERGLELVTHLEREPDQSGASLFIAAEIARDTLRAPKLAETLYRRIVETPGGATLAPKALLALAALRPDSAAAFHQRLKDSYPGTPWAEMLDGGDPGNSPAWATAERLLRVRFENAARVLADSLRARTAASTPAPPPGTAPPVQTP